MEKMVRWCQLREAQSALRGVCPDDVGGLRMIFNLLDLNGDMKVSVAELHGAGILTPPQVDNLMKVAGQQHDLFQARALAAAALFHRQIEDSESAELGRIGGPLYDGKLAFRDFCTAIKLGTLAQ